MQGRREGRSLVRHGRLWMPGVAAGLLAAGLLAAGRATGALSAPAAPRAPDSPEPTWHRLVHQRTAAKEVSATPNAAARSGAAARSRASTRTRAATRTGAGATAAKAGTAAASAAAAAQAGTLWTAFHATGAKPERLLLHDWTIEACPGRGWTERELAESARTLAVRLGVSHPRVRVRQTAGETPAGAAVVESSGVDADGFDVDVVCAIARSAVRYAVTVVRVEGAGVSRGSLTRSLARLEAVAAAAGGTPQISACVEGSLSARLIAAQQPSLIRRAYAAVHAERVEGVQSRVETSVSGYTPMAPTYILSSGRRINLQIAVHDDTYHQRTDVWVGTPIILTTY